MKSKLFIVFFLLVFSVYALLQGRNAPDSALKEGYVLLFDGGSLDGWSRIGGEATFYAESGEIVGRNGPGENTFLRTERTFSDFILTLEMRWDEPGNSGVLFRAGQENGNGRAYGYQYELDHSDRAWSGGIYDEARRGWLYPLDVNEEARQAIRMDDWNQVRIEARGASLKTWINDVPAAEIVDAMDLEGFIALQVHSGDTGVMRWRNIQIRELAPVASEAPTLSADDDWIAFHLDDWRVEGDSLGGVVKDGALITARRQFDDFSVRLQVPVCQQPTRIRVRQILENVDAYAELQVDDSGVSARSLSATGEVAAEPRELGAADFREVLIAAQGDAVTFTVDGQDVARFMGTGLPDRGQFEIEPATCGQRFIAQGLNWIDLNARSDEVLFYQTLDNEPAPVYSPQQALGLFRIAPGFEIELVAAEPLVEDPVAMAWDEYGRLYVVELRGYMPDAYGTGRDEPVGRVVRLTDADGDGRMDRSEVFLDKLVNPRAVAVVNEGVLVGEPPNLWLCELSGRDDTCASKRRVSEYGIGEPGASVEHLENALLPGLDNWLYNSKSGRRLRLVDGEIQSRESLFRGQWGITKDNMGRLLYNHNSNHITADTFYAEDLLDELTFTPPQGLGQVLTAPEEVFTVRVNPGVNRAYLDGTLRPDGRLYKATGVSGLVAYRGDQFPQAYRNDVFVPESAGNSVAQFRLRSEGLDMSAEHLLYQDEQWGQRDFLGSVDERFRPVDAKNGPDGALYVIDMYRGIIQDQHFLTDELREQIFLRGLDRPIGHGRIWRIRHSDGDADRAFPDLASASASELVDLIGDDNGWVRDTAQRLLIARPGQARAALEEQLGSDNTLAVIHALWTLEGRGELTRKSAQRALGRDNPWIVQQSLRAGRGLLQLEDLQAAADSPLAENPSVAMQLAFSLGDHAQDELARETLLALIDSHLNSALVRQAVVRAVRTHELEFLSALVDSPALSSESESGVALLADVAYSAYGSARRESTDEAAQRMSLLALLSLVASQSDDSAWRQLAMLGGMKRQALSVGFRPAELEEAPPIFADSSIDEDNPLWDARLNARSAFTWPGDELALGIKPLSPTQLALMEKGAGIYNSCANCHGRNGAGIEGLAPALASAPWVLAPPEHLGRVILQGYDSERNGVMPPHSHVAELDDETLAGLMIYLRRSWGNAAKAVDVEMAAAIRRASAERDRPWTAQELAQVPVDHGYGRFVGQYKVSFITMTVAEADGRLMLEVPMYGGGALEQVSDTEFEGTAGSESIKIEFDLEDDGSVNRMLLHRGGQIIPVNRVGGG